MNLLRRIMLAASLLVLPTSTFSQTESNEGYIQLFNGKDLSGWKINEHPESIRIENGCLVVNGPRAHLFYVGEDGQASFQNFHFKAEVMTTPGSNSGIYFHTKFLESGWPNKGYEAQVNNSQGDPKRTGGLYNVADVFVAPAKDNEWFTYEIQVQGKHIVVKINGKTTADYTEPEGLDRPERQLSSGTFALQAHDPDSKVLYRNLEVRPLP